MTMPGIASSSSIINDSDEDQTRRHLPGALLSTALALAATVSVDPVVGQVRGCRPGQDSFGQPPSTVTANQAPGALILAP
jgi:hypothetical protein